MDSLPSRRTVLRSGAVAAVGTLAGCLGSGDDDDPNGNESGGPNGNESGGPNGNESGDLTDYEFRKWVIPDNQLVPDAELVCQYFAYDRALANDVVVYEPERTAGANLVVEIENDDPEVDPASVEAELRVGPSRGSILFGEFDTDEIVSALVQNGREELDSRGEYRIVGIDGVGTTAVGPNEVLATTTYGDHLDAAQGKGTRLEDEDPAADRLFDLLPEGYVTAVSYHSSLSDLVISGESRTEFETAESDQFVSRSVRVFVFDSAASATTDRAREIMNTGRGFEEIFTEEASGRAVTVEYAPVTG